MGSGNVLCVIPVGSRNDGTRERGHVTFVENSITPSAVDNAVGPGEPGPTRD